MLPAFALVFPAEIAVAATAIVHLLNNLFKLVLVGRHAVPRVVVGFGLPALVAAIAGAAALTLLAGLPTLTEYSFAGRVFAVTTEKLILGALILGFAVLELAGDRSMLRVAGGRLWAGGLLAGFFGGLSGHQGALRSAFLVGCGLSRSAFIGTGVVCAVLVDLARLTVYGTTFLGGFVAAGGEAAGLIAAATLAAFAGAFAGARMLGKVTLSGLRRLVGLLMVLLGLALAAGML